MPRILAGKRDRKVTFYPRAVVSDGLGVERETDGAPIVAWAYVRFGTGTERREAAQAGSQQTATFRVLSSARLRQADERWEIEYLGARWGIASIVPVGVGEDIEFTATKKGA